MRDHIYVQSIAASQLRKNGGHDVYYRLREPSPEYARFYIPFLWIVTFTKHFIEFLIYREQDVRLEDFRQGFSVWLQRTYSTEELHSWQMQYSGQDFRRHVNAHVEFLWKECYGLVKGDPSLGLLDHPLWTLVGPKDLDAIPAQPIVETGTIVTPFAAQCFSTSYFSKILEVRQIEDLKLAARVELRKSKLGLTPGTFHNDANDDSRGNAGASHCPIPLLQKADHVVKGDVVALRPEDSGSWKSTVPVWYAYVQDIREHRLDILWLYQPSDTTLGNARYPFPNELFMSDNCGCDRSSTRDSIDIDQVLGIAHISWFPDFPAETDGLFIRRKYRTQSHDFVMLHEGPYQCDCGRQTALERCRSEFAIGDTVLISSPFSSRLECAQILGFDENEGSSSGQVLYRIFGRRQERHPAARPNEVVPEQTVLRCSPNRVERRCHIRTFGKLVPSPYNRDGTGDLFYVLKDNSKSDLPPWKEGWDPTALATYPPLTGLGLFVGGGGLDRGLEDGGAVAFSHAVEWGPNALHTYLANARHPVECFLGSVNDYLAQALKGGSMSSLIASPGEIDVIGAGSPCQAFSRMQLNPYNMQSIRNASMVASLISFADLYAPEYLILENVLGMCSSTGPAQGLLQQIMAGLVGLGYQLQTFLGDAWSCGSSQGRSRVFVVASAPGLTPFEPLARTHSHPRLDSNRAQALGKLSNGLSFGDRMTGPTPFEGHTAGEAVADLPFIGDGIVHICPEFPDHRLSVVSNARHRKRIEAVPLFPRGVGLLYAYSHGLLSGEPKDFYERGTEFRRAKNSKIYSRIDPDGHFPTILTAFSATDAITGRILHWDQNRMLTVQEARRAQGWPDEEVLIGPPAKQLHIVGNCVDRKVSLALGRCLHTSWTSSFNRQGEKIRPL
jgi:DNA (cytosine-5)-methyltransferase 1